MRLVDFLAQACHFAQEHIDDPEAWSLEGDESSREVQLECTSFMAACFLSQNTVRGSEGVEWSVIIKELVEHPMKSIDEWRVILDARALELCGWTDGRSDILREHVAYWKSRGFSEDRAFPGEYVLMKDPVDLTYLRLYESGRMMIQSRETGEYELATIPTERDGGASCQPSE